MLIKIPVKRLNEKKELADTAVEVGLKFGMISLQVQASMDIAKESSVASIVKTIWSGIVNYCLVKQIENPVNFEEVSDYVEDLMAFGDEEKIIDRAMKEFSESRSIQKLTEEAKKKTELISTS